MAKVSGTLDPVLLARTALDETAALLRAGAGSLHVFGLDGAPVAAASLGRIAAMADAPRSADAWAAVLDAPGAVRCAVTASAIVPADAGDAIAVAMRDGDTPVGVLVLADRHGVEDEFAAADVSRLDKLAALLATKVRKALLHADLEHAALHDALTGELNRFAFERHVAAVRTPAGSVDAVVIVGLDHFKEVNDTLGRTIGDRVLVAAAGRVADLLGGDDAVFARVGGDEFAVLVRRPSLDDVLAFARSVLDLSSTPITVDEMDVVVLASVGIAIVEAGDRADPNAVLHRANAAMCTAKHDHSGHAVYGEETDARPADWVPILTGLRAALDADGEGLEVHYQPKVDLVTGRVIGAEALVRWNHPRRGWIAPNEFVRVAEESGLIKQLTQHVLRMAVATARSWADDGDDLSVAVNLSSHDLLDVSLPDRVAALLDEHQLPPHRLTLELTESALLSDKPRATSTIDRLAGLGVRLSLDDFGTGYSSLGYLRRLPVSELKVDQSFVKNLLLDAQDEVIVRSTIDLGHNLGLQVVAEGIENQPVYERLQALGCDIGQGYGISRPLAPALFRTWLRTSPYEIRRTDVTPGVGHQLAGV